jgi:hypothetical protein
MEEENKWRIKKEVSLGDLIAFTSAVLAVLYAYFTLDKRITKVEDAVITQAKIDERQDREVAVFRNDIKDDLRDIKEQLRDVRDTLNRRK